MRTSELTRAIDEIKFTCKMEEPVRPETNSSFEVLYVEVSVMRSLDLGNNASGQVRSRGTAIV